MSRILVVDDEKPIREAVQAILEGMGHQVGCAGNGHEALAKLAEGRVDLMITDIFMPEMEGLETIQQVRKRFPDLKVIAMSGGTPRGPKVDYLKLARTFGAKRVLEKPFTAEKLREVLREAGLADGAPTG